MGKPLLCTSHEASVGRSAKDKSGSVLAMMLLLVLGNAPGLWCQTKPEHKRAAREMIHLEVGPAIGLPVTGIAQQLWASAAGDEPGRLLVCTLEADPRDARLSSSAYVSLDGGSTWMRTLVDAHSDWVSESNCAAGTKGRAYFVAGVSDTSSGALDHSLGSSEVYRSSDGGLTWAGPRRYPFIDWMQLAVPAAGEPELVYLFGNEQAVGNGEAGAGSWEGKWRPMRKSSDGLLFSMAAYPESTSLPGRDQGFPLNAIVMNSGEAVVLFGEIPSQSLDLYAAGAERYRYLSRIELPLGTKAHGVLSAQMAFDREGRYRGRLYVVITALEEQRPVLVLARSDDEGRSWRSHVLIRSESRLSEQEIVYFYAAAAVNAAGTLAIEWSQGSPCPLFAVSEDGGESVAQSLRLGSCARNRDAGRLGLVMDTNLNTYNDRSPVDHPLAFSRSASPGFSLQALPNLLGALRIAADAAGRFHAFWVEPLWDRIRTLTATVDPAPRKQEKVQLKGREELTSSSAVRVQDESFDPETGTFSLDLRIRNIGSWAMPYPRWLAVVADRSDCGELRYLGALTVSELDRPVLEVPSLAARSNLLPGEDSLPVHLTVQTPGCASDHISVASMARQKARRPASFFPLAVRFGVYGEPAVRRQRDGTQGTDVSVP